MRITINKLLNNYYTFLDRIDAHIKEVEVKFQDEIACKKGCDECCKFLSLFPVEAVSIAGAFSSLDTTMQKKIITQLEKNPDVCPLLIDSECALYSNRPIICRTHGFPLYIEKQGEPFIDFCPKNFTTTTNFPKDVLLALEHLNTTLTAINKQFIEGIETDTPLPDRIPMSQALTLLDD